MTIVSSLHHFSDDWRNIFPMIGGNFFPMIGENPFFNRFVKSNHFLKIMLKYYMFIKNKGKEDYCGFFKLIISICVFYAASFYLFFCTKRQKESRFTHFQFNLLCLGWTEVFIITNVRNLYQLVFCPKDCHRTESEKIFASCLYWSIRLIRHF